MMLISPLQGFLVSIFRVDADFAIKAARQKHLQRPNQAQSGSSTAAGNQPANAPSGPSTATGNPPSNSPSLSDPLAGYLGVPWGSSFAEVKQKLAAKAAGNYQRKPLFRSGSGIEGIVKWSKRFATLGVGVCRFVRRFRFLLLATKQERRNFFSIMTGFMR